MISNSKSFIIQAFIALTILASSLMSPVNATAIAPAPARQFLFCNLVVRGGALLTPDLGFARQAQGNERTAVPTTATTATNEKRFGKLLFLRLIRTFANFLSRSIPEVTQNAAWAALQENNKRVRERRDRIQAWATATTGPSSAQGGPSQAEGGLDPHDEEPSLDVEDGEFVPSEWSGLLAAWAREPGPNDDVTDKVTAD